MTIRKFIIGVAIFFTVILLYIIIATAVQSYMANQVYEKSYKVK